jgi:sugar phosphate permease
LITVREDDSGMGVIILIIVIFFVVKVWPRANPGVRLFAIGGSILGLVLLIGVASLHAGETIAIGFLDGVRQIVFGFADFIKMF